MKDKPLYAISIVSELLDIHPQTLRQYERIGLISPSRSNGNTRLYSDDDLDLIKFITLLTRDNGINLAGVEMILEMQKEIEKLNIQLTEISNSIKHKYGETVTDKSVDKKSIKINIIRG